MTIAPATTDELDAFIEILEEVAVWLWDRGIHQWPPGSNRAQREIIRAQIESGALLAARDAAGLLGGCVLTTEPYPAWDGHAGAAAYLHKLAVARRAAGRGLGARIVSEALAWAAAAGAPLLRLDCWDGNARLREYYRALAFTELGAALEHGYAVRLFERRVALSSPATREPQ